MIFWIACFGAAGVVSRYLVSKAANSYFKVGEAQGLALPIGTMSVNIIGSFLMGFLLTIFVFKMNVGDPFKSAVLVGFLGGFTTFSSFSLEIVKMVEGQQWMLALSYIFLSVIFCVIMCLLGVWLGKSLI